MFGSYFVKAQNGVESYDKFYSQFNIQQDSISDKIASEKINYYNVKGEWIGSAGIGKRNIVVTKKSRPFNFCKLNNNF